MLFGIDVRDPIGESQKISLEFWRKTLSSSAENYCPIVRHILAYYYECLIMDHKVVMRTKLPIKSWELSNQQYYNLGIPLSNWSVYKWMRARSNYMNDFPTCILALYCPNIHYNAFCHQVCNKTSIVCPLITWLKTRDLFTDVSEFYVRTTQKCTTLALQPHSGTIPEKKKTISSTTHIVSKLKFSYV